MQERVFFGLGLPSNMPLRSRASCRPTDATDYTRDFGYFSVPAREWDIHKTPAKTASKEKDHVDV